MTWRGDASGARHNCDVELWPKREAHRNTRECVCEKTADEEVTKATDTLVPPPEDPVKRRLMKKTDLRNGEIS